MKHRVIPIFIPELACPNQCIYCNQRVISGQLRLPTEKEIIMTIETHLATINENTFVELGFFGGNFTGIDKTEQKRLFLLVKPYLDSGKIKGIRLSTRPDYINEEIVKLLKQNGVTTVELGVQSMDEEVLNAIQRGYTPKQVDTAAKIIIENGLELGMQMMVGLPMDTPEKSLQTAKKIISCGAKNTRIYPTLVIQHTQLATMYEKGIYNPLLLQDAIAWIKPILYLFEMHNVTVLRVGLHPTEGFIKGTDYLKGPFHVAFKELVQTEIWNDLFRNIPLTESEEIQLLVPQQQLNAAIGHHAKNKNRLLAHYKKVKFIADHKLNKYEYTYMLVN